MQTEKDERLLESAKSRRQGIIDAIVAELKRLGHEAKVSNDPGWRGPTIDTIDGIPCSTYCDPCMTGSMWSKHPTGKLALVYQNADCRRVNRREPAGGFDVAAIAVKLIEVAGVRAEKDKAEAKRYSAYDLNRTAAREIEAQYELWAGSIEVTSNGFTLNVEMDKDAMRRVVAAYTQRPV